MNREARQLGLRHTHYANPIGLDDPRNYSTAADLAKLASIDMRNRAFARIVDLTHATLQERLARAHGHQPQRPRGTLPASWTASRPVTPPTRATCWWRPRTVAGARVISVVLGEPSASPRATPTRSRCCATASRSTAAWRCSRAARRSPACRSISTAATRISCPRGPSRSPYAAARRCACARLRRASSRDPCPPGERWAGPRCSWTARWCGRSRS